MSDRRRIVTIAADGTVTTVKDLENGTTLFAVRDSFTIKAADRQQSMAAIPRRYAGQRIANETHANAEISWKFLAQGATADAAIQNVEGVLSVLELARTDLYLEWRPDGATDSSYYEVRGPAKWNPTYQWVQFAGARSMYIDVAIPVAPLARGAVDTQTIPSTNLPAVIALGAPIAGDAPALADIAMRTSGGTAPPVWAMLAWTKRPAAPLAGSVAPFGIIEGESGTLTDLASTVSTAAHGGNFAAATVSGAGSASGLYSVDPSVMQPDDFSYGEIDIEVWARVLVDEGVPALTATLSLQPAAGLSFGAERFSAEHGATGKVLTRVAAGGGQKWRATKLGTLTMPVDPAAPLKWNVKAALAWPAGSGGVVGIDYLVLVPARQRALGPTAKPNDSTYPKFIASTADTTKTIRADLSGRVASAAANSVSDHGLGGSPLELPPGNTDLLIWSSSAVPDDPTIDASNMNLDDSAGTVGTVTLRPRYWLARGA